MIASTPPPLKNALNWTLNFKEIPVADRKWWLLLIEKGEIFNQFYQ